MSDEEALPARIRWVCRFCGVKRRDTTLMVLEKGGVTCGRCFRDRQYSSAWEAVWDGMTGGKSGH